MSRNNSEILDPDTITWDDLGIDDERYLVVHNDEVNTFDWVIRCFVEILNHTSQQAEQLAMLIHYKGQATVKTAPLTVLQPLKDAINNRGLNSTIE